MLSHIQPEKLKKGFILLHCRHDIGSNVRNKDQHMGQKITLGVHHDPHKKMNTEITI